MVEPACEGHHVGGFDELLLGGPGTRGELLWLDVLEHRQVQEGDLTLWRVTRNIKTKLKICSRMMNDSATEWVIY